jgi:hypothetical protein
MSVVAHGFWKTECMTGKVVMESIYGQEDNGSKLWVEFRSQLSKVFLATIHPLQNGITSTATTVRRSIKGQ